LNSNLGHFSVSTILSLFHVENRVCLSCGVQVIGVTWGLVTKIMAGVGDLMQSIGDGQAQVGYSVAGRSRDRVTLCVVCTMHKEMRSAGVTPGFKAKTRCSSYVCPGSSCHTYGQNVSIEYQCLYYIVSYYTNSLQVQKGLNSGIDTIMPQAVDRGLCTPRRSLHQRTPHLLNNREYGKCEYIKYSASVGNKRHAGL
jgi:hypothetical protein